MMATEDDEPVLLRQPFSISCSSKSEARDLHARFPKISALLGETVFFSRSIRIREVKPAIKTARKPQKQS